jgi:multidrug efflux pump subunit AcrA (membrane-fusion protein)
MFARATVNFGNANHVLVPDMALVKQIGAGDRYVYVYKDGKVSYNKVELGKHLGDQYEILSGVNDGDEVVIAGQTRLANGREVEVIK